MKLNQKLTLKFVSVIADETPDISHRANVIFRYLTKTGIEERFIYKVFRSGGATPLVDVGDIRREAVGGRRRRRRLAPPLVFRLYSIVDFKCRHQRHTTHAVTSAEPIDFVASD
ncbi:hypothetical protein EVAR_30926_1 [Eumeta japonica]|uniref:DUF4371 domain-containing protein n=1 Tax=Eumeta variegata TaxID=151549 RepID=A0A4C1V4P2_EUMVA|nr:hypothetical protein EVAR_30926_1 [Eumeta japonica]